MTKIYFTLLLVVVSVIGYSQEGKPDSGKLTPLVNQDDNLLYNTAGIEKKPEYPGGLGEFYKYVGRNYKTPNVKGLQGKVFVMFVVEKDGSLSDIKVLRDIGHGTGEEAVRVLKNCEKWAPGEQDGKKVRVLYSLPLTIRNP